MKQYNQNGNSTYAPPPWFVSARTNKKFISIASFRFAKRHTFCTFVSKNYG